MKGSGSSRPETLVTLVGNGRGSCKDLLVNNIIGHTGFRPDLSITQECQVHHCYATEGPMKLAAQLMATGGGGGDCLAQVSPGPDSLRSPEPGLFVIGMKSYGRSSAYLLRLGHEQVEGVLHLMGVAA